MKKYSLLVVLMFAAVFVYSQSRNKNINEFFERPFQGNIVMPDVNYAYKNYDELYNKIGIPLNRKNLNVPKSYNMADSTYEFEYEHYNIGTVYAESKDVIYIFFIWITLEEGINYTHNIQKGDSLEKIEKIFGKADYISNYENGILEYHYFGDFFGALNIQLENGKLKSIILWNRD